MKISRAAFLKALGCAGLGTCLDIAAPSIAAAAGDGGGGPQVPPGAPTSLHNVTAAHFRVHVGDTFAVRSSGNERYVLTLAEVAERPVVRGVEHFSLIFHAPPGTALGDGTHVFSHPQFGALDLFISPIGPKNRPRAVYQACFNRHTAASGHRRT